jgi:hypothetical protein
MQEMCMRILGIGHIIFAVAIAGLGMLSLITGHFAAVWQPVPTHLPARVILAHINGALMLVLGADLLVKRTAEFAAIILTAYLLIWFFFLHGPIVASAPLVADNWSGFGENGTLIVGGLILIATFTTHNNRSWLRFLKGEAGVRKARVVFAFAAFLMSLDNLAYPKANADFPPAWIPHWYGWGYLVGSAYIATGLAILFRVCPRLATNSAAVMMSLFTLLCWVSFVVQTPDNRLNWTGLLISSALTGAAWMVAESYRDDPWFKIPWLNSKSLLKNRAINSEGRP